MMKVAKLHRPYDDNIIQLFDFSHIKTDAGKLHVCIDYEHVKHNMITHSKTYKMWISVDSNSDGISGSDILEYGRLTIAWYHGHRYAKPVWDNSIENDYYLSNLKIHDVGGKHHHLIAPKLAELGEHALDTYLDSSYSLTNSKALNTLKSTIINPDGNIKRLNYDIIKSE